MHARPRALHRGGHQGGDARHPAPHPTRLKARRDPSLAAAHTVTPVTQAAERMASLHVRARRHLQTRAGVVKELQGRVQEGRRHKRRREPQRDLHVE
jgi:hypothetical protein